MATELLVEDRIDDGHRLLIELVRDGVDVSAAAWLKTSEEGLWHLYAGSPAFDVRNLGTAYQTVYACLQRIPSARVELAQVKLVHASDPITRELAALRDRQAGGRVPTRYGGPVIGKVAIEEAYIYPRITPGLTRDEVVQTVTGLINQTGVRPSVVTLRDGTVIHGVPYGLERNRKTGQTLEIKLLEDAGSTRVIQADEVANIQ